MRLVDPNEYYSEDEGESEFAFSTLESQDGEFQEQEESSFEQQQRMREGLQSRPKRRRGAAARQSVEQPVSRGKGAKAPASPKPKKKASKSGLLGRLRNIRNKETSRAESGDEGQSVAEPPRRQSMSARRASTSQRYPTPKETLGFSAFQKSRGSTDPSAVTGHDEDGSITPLRTSRNFAENSNSSADLRLRDAGRERQADLVERRRSQQVKRPVHQRYSIADSVEASLIDSWSNAQGNRPYDDGEHDDDDATDITDDDWLKGGAGPPMTSASVTSEWREARLASDEEDEESVTTTAPRETAGRNRKKAALGAGAVGGAAIASRSGRSKRMEAANMSRVASSAGASSRRGASYYQDADLPEDNLDDQDRHTAVNALLARLEASGPVLDGDEEVDDEDFEDEELTEGEYSDEAETETEVQRKPATRNGKAPAVAGGIAVAGATAAAATAAKHAKNGKSAPQSPAVPASKSKRNGRGAAPPSTALFAANTTVPSELYVGGDDEPLKPDDSVSIRAMQRAEDEKKGSRGAPLAAAAAIGAPLAGAAAANKGMARKAATPKARQQAPQEDLAAMMANMEPAFASDSEEEDLPPRRSREKQRELVDQDDYDDFEGEDDDDLDPQIMVVPSPHRQSRSRYPDMPPSSPSSRRTSGAIDPRRSSKRQSTVNPSRRRKRAQRPSGGQGRESWLLDSGLSAEQTHYFLKTMVSEELDWELARAFAFDPSQPSQSGQSPLPSPVSSSSGRKESEYAVFKKLQTPAPSSRGGRSSASGQVGALQLPLVRFLFEAGFCMLPMFGSATTLYEKRKNRATRFWHANVLPVLRVLQSRSLSHRLDRYGEGDGRPFSASSTLDILAGGIQRAAVRFITATLNVGGSEEGKVSWPYPSASVMKLPAFTPYRIPLEPQGKGAYEVDVVCMRPRGAETAYIMRVRKNVGPPSIFVIRTEADFFDYAQSLRAALPKSYIRPPPSAELAMMPAEYRELIRAVDPATLGAPKAAAASQPQTQGANTKSEKAQGGLGGLFGLSRSNGNKNGSANGSTNNLNGQQPRDSISASRSGSVFSSGATYIDENPNASKSTLVNPKQSSKPSKGGFAGGLFGGQKDKSSSDDNYNYELRRVQLRDWLRDTLSARGAGSHSETKEFLSSNSFTDRDLKKSTKEKIASNHATDVQSTRQREEQAMQASEEVLELREQIDAMWEDCKFGEGFLQAQAVFQKATSFSQLPEEYQGLVSYLHLKTARMLDGIFVTGDQASDNLRRAKAVISAVPWKLLTVVMSEPTGLMVQDLKRTLSNSTFLHRIIGAVMDDDNRRIDQELGELRRRLPTDFLRKIRKFVEATPDETKRLIRDQAAKAGIPLVAAILRGNTSPLLQGRDLAKIISATKTYQMLYEEQLTIAEMREEATGSRDIALIQDLQKALQLYSIRRDGHATRELMRSRTFRKALAGLTQPLIDAVAKMHHRRKPLKQVIRTLQTRLYALVELLQTLRTRVHDPARNIDILTTFLDSHAHDTVSILSALTPLFPWLHTLAHTVGEGSFDLAREWAPPSSMMDDFQDGYSPLGHTAMDNIKGISGSAWLRRIRQMEVCSRWIAGDLEADQEVQVLGGGEGDNETRRSQILPEEPMEEGLDMGVFKGFFKGFRDALGKALESRER